MPTPFESARLNLQLYDLRREPVLREARAWFLADFNPATLEDVMTALAGERNPSVRMVLGYWDMAASLVTQGAIPAAMFNEANTEHFAVYAKLRPFLEEVRATTTYADYLTNVEQVIAMHPRPEERIAIFARYLERQRGLAVAGKQRPNYPLPTADDSISRPTI